MRRNNSRGIGRMFTEAGGIAERLPLLDGVAQVEVVQKKKWSRQDSNLRHSV